MSKLVSLQRLIAIVSCIPADMQIRDWVNPRLDPDLDRLIFSKYNGVVKPAATVLQSLKYVPCKVSRPGKDITDFPVYTQPDDGSDRAVAWITPWIVSVGSDLVVKEFDAGKYTAVYVPGRVFKVLRHDEVWRDLTGDKFVSELFQKAAGIYD